MYKFILTKCNYIFIFSLYAIIKVMKYEYRGSKNIYTVI